MGWDGQWGPSVAITLLTFIAQFDPEFSVQPYFESFPVRMFVSIV